ncbi:unnamed protein product [Rhizophagus irregularis]|nr:unnamed protein product [Rhizophagus irregularis]
MILYIDAQNIQVLPANSDSNSDNECIKETEITYFTKNLGYTRMENHFDAFNNIQYLLVAVMVLLFKNVLFLVTLLLQIMQESAKESNIVPFLILLINAEHCEVDFKSDLYKQINKDNNENNKENYTYI